MKMRNEAQGIGKEIWLLQLDDEEHRRMLDHNNNLQNHVIQASVLRKGIHS
jgi:hypothetical protein